MRWYASEIRTDVRRCSSSAGDGLKVRTSGSAEPRPGPGGDFGDASAEGGSGPLPNRAQRLFGGNRRDRGLELVLEPSGPVWPVLGDAVEQFTVFEAPLSRDSGDGHLAGLVQRGNCLFDQDMPEQGFAIRGAQAEEPDRQHELELVVLLLKCPGCFFERLVQFPLACPATFLFGPGSPARKPDLEASKNLGSVLDITFKEVRAILVAQLRLRARSHARLVEIDELPKLVGYLRCRNIGHRTHLQQHFFGRGV